MERKVFLYIEEQYERHGYPRHTEIMTQGRLISEDNLLRLEYAFSPENSSDRPIAASVMRVDQAWHVTRPSFGPEMLTLHPRLMTQNEYAGEDSLTALPVELSWNDREDEGDVTVSMRVAREKRAFHPYSLSIHYVKET